MSTRRSWRATVGAIGGLGMLVFFAAALVWGGFDAAPSGVLVPAAVVMLVCVPFGLWENHRTRE